MQRTFTALAVVLLWLWFSSLESSASGMEVHVSDAAELVRALDEAGGVDPVVIEIDSAARIDLDGYMLPLRVAPRVTIRSDRGGLRPGGLVHVDSLVNPDDSRRRAVFEIRTEDVRIEGIQLVGPYGGTAGGPVGVSGILVRGQVSVDIVGNEISNFSFAAVEVRGGRDHQDHHECRSDFRLPSVKIERNFLHHNQRANLGYGVGVYDGAYPLISGNTFDWNRHAVASDGDAESGYIATSNLVLSGGAVYGNWPRRHYNQHFDMHGTDGGDGGVGGDIVMIAGNSIWGAQKYGGVLGVARRTRPAYWLRGTPCRQNAFINNVVEHRSGEALRENSVIPQFIDNWGNEYDTNTSWDLGVGDFDGDGRDDLFQATGAGWYYSSGGSSEWRLLRGGAWLTLDQLRFGDFDGDGTTDVFTRQSGKWRVSWGGASSWQDLNTSSISLISLGFGDFDGDGTTDVFRANGTQWFYSSAGTGPWLELARSQFVVDELRIADFDGDGTDDVFSFSAGQWSVSYGGTSSWQRLNAKLGGNLEELAFADFDDDGRIDIASSRRSGPRTEWRVSSGGTTPWMTFGRVDQTDQSGALHRHWIGDFDGTGGADALRYLPTTIFNLTIDGTTLVRFSSENNEYVPHGDQPMR